MTAADPKTYLWRNIGRLMGVSSPSIDAVQKRTGVARGTIQRIKEAATSVGTDKLLEIATALGTEPWVLLLPDEDDVVRTNRHKRDRPAEGYIRLEHLSPSPAMGDGRIIDEPMHVVQHLDVLETWVRQKVGSTNPNRIKVLSGAGRSMYPTISDQDLVFVDVGCKQIELPGIYVFDVAERLLLKRALILTTGVLILRSDNVEEFPDEERHDLKRAADTITVGGRVLAWWTLKSG